MWQNGRWQRDSGNINNVNLSMDALLFKKKPPVSLWLCSLIYLFMKGFMELKITDNLYLLNYIWLKIRISIQRLVWKLTYTVWKQPHWRQHCRCHLPKLPWWNSCRYEIPLLILIFAVLSKPMIYLITDCLRIRYF